MNAGCSSTSTRSLASYLDRIATAGFDRLIMHRARFSSLGAVVLAQRGARAGRAAPQPPAFRRGSCAGRETTSRDVDLERRLRIPGLEHGARIWRSRARSCSRHDRATPRRATLCTPTCRCVKDWSSTTSRGTASGSRRPIAIPTSAGGRRRAAERPTTGPSTPTGGATGRGALRSDAPDHGSPTREREWLEYAAILHDIGVHISYERHHKHSYYLIKNGDLRGFDPDEIETIALLTRYHRRVSPKRAGTPASPTSETASRDPGWRRSCGSRKAWIAATRRSSRPSIFTTGGTMGCCRSGPEATRSSSCGRPGVTRSRSSG